MMKKVVRLYLVLQCLILSFALKSFDEFIINDIRIIGLQRVSVGSIFTAIPVSVGDKINNNDVNGMIRALFLTEQFNNIEIGRDGNALIILVEERPSIASISIEGNKALKSEDLLEGLSGAGIAEGQVYKRSTLEAMKGELVRQYSSQGRYGAGVEVNTQKRPRNTIDLSILIDEGQSASIRDIKIIGNSLFSTDELLETFELKEGGFFSFINNNNRYSKEKLEGDIENLESFYLDRGYLKFSLESVPHNLFPQIRLFMLIIQSYKIRQNVRFLCGFLYFSRVDF